FGAVTKVVEIFKDGVLTPPSMSKLELGVPAMTATIDYHKKVPITAFVGIAFEIGRKALKYMLEELNEMKVERYCGKRHERGREYSRNGVRERTIVTSLGEVALNLTRIRDKGIPLYDVVDFESKRRYQSDLKGISVDSAVKMSYRDSRDEVNRFTQAPSHQSIWRYVQEEADDLKESEVSYDTYFSIDDTKLHSRGRKLKLTLVEGDNIEARVNKEHENLKGDLNLNGLGVGDAAKELRCLDDRQIDLIHVFTEVNYKLWEHGVDLNTRKWYVNEVRKVLLWLKNSLEMPDLKERIDKASKKIRSFIKEMDRQGYWKAANFFTKYSRNILLFAYKKLQGIKIPWHNNHMERRMGEISKRMKNKWMSWSVKGAENMASLVTKRACQRKTYEKFISKIMKNEDIKWEVNLHL
ncbi:MAG: transposase, partial [Archaeoglobaceae archaeon]